MINLIKSHLESSFFMKFITTLILLNGITLGLSTFHDLTPLQISILHYLDLFFITVFSIEIISKIIVYRADFVKDPWNIFDFIIVSIALLPTSGAFSIIRALRILRLFRLISVIPQMKIVVNSLLSVIPGALSVLIILSLIYYVFAILGVNLFGEKFPIFFGTISSTMFTLFQLMTLEGWSGDVARPIMAVYPYSWTYFVGFILIATFVLTNLLLGIIVEAISSMKHSHLDKNGNLKDDFEIVEDDITIMRAELKEIKTLLIQQQKQQK